MIGLSHQFSWDRQRLRHPSQHHNNDGSRWTLFLLTLTCQGWLHLPRPWNVCSLLVSRNAGSRTKALACNFLYLAVALGWWLIFLDDGQASPGPYDWAIAPFQSFHHEHLQGSLRGQCLGVRNRKLNETSEEKSHTNNSIYTYTPPNTYIHHTHTPHIYTPHTYTPLHTYATRTYSI